MADQNPRKRPEVPVDAWTGEPDRNAIDYRRFLADSNPCKQRIVVSRGWRWKLLWRVDDEAYRLCVLGVLVEVIRAPATDPPASSVEPEPEQDHSV